MKATQTRRTHEEVEALANVIFERRVRSTLGLEDEGKFLAIDVDSEDFEIDRDDYTAVMRLRSRRPNAESWLMRIGSPTTYRMGLIR